MSPSNSCPKGFWGNKLIKLLLRTGMPRRAGRYTLTIESLEVESVKSQCLDLRYQTCKVLRVGVLIE